MSQMKNRTPLSTTELVCYVSSWAGHPCQCNPCVSYRENIAAHCAGITKHIFVLGIITYLHLVNTDTHQQPTREHYFIHVKLQWYSSTPNQAEGRWFPQEFLGFDYFCRRWSSVWCSLCSILHHILAALCQYLLRLIRSAAEQCVRGQWVRTQYLWAFYCDSCFTSQTEEEDGEEKLMSESFIC